MTEPTLPPPSNPIVVIPARMASTRLPGKPLADILGAPMIVHVLRRALEAKIGPVVVACAEPEIARAVEAAGGTAVLTKPDHPSGSDRIFEALRLIDPEGRHDAVVNVQGDLPTVEPETVRAAFAPLANPAVDIATLVVPITREEERTDPNVVKAVLELAPGAAQGRALYFTRATAPWGEGALFHHIGLYAYRRAALERFVALPPSALEQREKLEQLRALANGMRIDAAVVDAVPLGVDTPADLERARALLSGRSSP
ncbi:3-deoxy-manno-octulosonate cytidylyltransferase [Azospirillum doebereinerae]